MTKLSRYFVAGSIACATVLAAGGASAASINDELARIDQLLANAPTQTTAVRTSPTVEAINLRAAAEASLRAGDEPLAEAQAKLALHELGEDGIPVNSAELAYTCIGGCPGQFLPSVSAEEVSQGADNNVRLSMDGQAMRAVSE